MKVKPIYTEKDYKIAKELSESKQKDRVLPRKYALRWGAGMLDYVVNIYVILLC